MTTLTEVFDKQENLQSSLGLGVGSENIIQWYNAMTAMVLEVGEALQEDTRWKKLINGNNKQLNVSRENVVEEMADVFIYFVNACLFYNISAEELLTNTEEKQNKNIRRLLCLKK